MSPRRLSSPPTTKMDLVAMDGGSHRSAAARLGDGSTVTRTNGWGYKQGPSMAGPHAVGVAALALSVAASTQ
jgi:subtilisin family serine protease